MVPELVMVPLAWLMMPLPPEFDIMMVSELRMVPALSMPIPLEFATKMVPELVMVPALAMVPVLVRVPPTVMSMVPKLARVPTFSMPSPSVFDIVMEPVPAASQYQIPTAMALKTSAPSPTTAASQY